jgi:molybdate transport system ATP-binding protein
MIDISVKKTRPNFKLDVNVKFSSGITALFGASGAGKSSLLNLIAGLEQPDSGRIRIGSEVLFDSNAKINLAVHKRRIGYVFQDALLLPHLTVRGNLRYGLRQGGMEFFPIVEFLGLSNLLERRPATLSGGERQRVAIGRALLSAPRLVLMDEPLASLDMERKREIFPYIEQLQSKFKIPVIFVSHAIEEVARLAQQVVVMREGKIAAEGSPQAVMNLPDGHASRFERTSILTAKPTSYDSIYGLTALSHPAGNISLTGQFTGGKAPIRIVVRATDVTLALSRPKDISARTMLKGAIAKCEVDGSPIAIIHVKLEGGEELSAALTRKAVDQMHLEPGQAIWCLLKSVSIDERWIASG